METNTNTETKPQPTPRLRKQRGVPYHCEACQADHAPAAVEAAK